MKYYEKSDAFKLLNRIQQKEKLTLGSPASLLLKLKSISVKSICLSFKITEEMFVNDIEHYIESYGSGIKHGDSYLEYLGNINKAISLVILRYLGYCSKFDLDIIEENYGNYNVLDTINKTALELDSKFGCSLNTQQTVLRKSVSVNYIKLGKYLGISPVTAFRALSLSYPSREFGEEIRNVNVKFNGIHYSDLRTINKQTWISIDMLYDAYRYTIDRYYEYDESYEVDITKELYNILRSRYDVVGYTQEIGPFLLMTDDDYKKVPNELIGKLDWLNPKTWAYYDEESGSCYTIVDKFETDIKKYGCYGEYAFSTYIADREAEKKIVNDSDDLSKIMEDAERYGLNRLTVQFIFMIYYNYCLGKTFHYSTIRLDNALLLVTGKLLVNGKIYNKFADFPFSKEEQRIVSKIKLYSTFGLRGTTNQENIGFYAKLAFINPRFDYTGEYGISRSNLEKLDTMYSTILLNANRAVLDTCDIRNRLKQIALDQEQYIYKFAIEKEERNKLREHNKNEEKLKREQEQAERKTREEARWKKQIAKQCATDYVIIKSKAYKTLQEALDVFGIAQVHKELLSLPGVSKSAFVCFHIAEKNGLASYTELSKLSDAEKVIYIKNCIQLVSKL